MGSKRLDYLDIAKGIGILLVVLGHIYGNDNNFHVWIYSFHMPLFYFISGITFKSNKYNDVIELLNNKIKSLGVPYVVFNILNLTLNLIFLDYSKEKFILCILYVFSFTGYGAMWFLPSLLIVQIIFYLIDKYISKEVIKNLIFLAIFILTYILSKFNYNIIMLVFYRAFIGLIFFVSGNYLFNYIKNKKIKYSEIIFLLFINVITCFINGRIELWELRLNNIILYFISSITGTMFIIYTCKKIKNNKLLEYIGSNSLIIMCTHQIIIELISEIISIKEYTAGIAPILLFIVVILIEIPILKFVNNHKWIIGKLNKIEVKSYT